MIGGECVIFDGPKDRDGYGRSWISGRRAYARAHRLAWEKLHGQIPDELCVLHRCDNPPCVNPEHLFLGTRGDNNRDSIAKGRDRKVSGNAHYLRTHPEKVLKGSQLPWAKLTERKIRKIRRLRADGMTFRAIGKMFGVHAFTVQNVIKGRTWTHVEGAINKGG